MLVTKSRNKVVPRVFVLIFLDFLFFYEEGDKLKLVTKRLLIREFVFSDDLDLFERHGKPVEELIVEDVDAAIDVALDKVRLGKEEFETAAILAMNEQDAFSIYQRLKMRFADVADDEKIEFSYLNRDSQNFKKGLTVTTFYLAKGLEFDQVFTVFDGKKDSSLLRQARYICSTRALHELYMIRYE